MKTTIIKTLLTNRWRQERLIMKNWLTAYVVFVFGVGFFLLSFPALLSLARVYEHFLRIGIAVLLCALMPGKRFPLLYVHPATFHFLGNSRDIHTILIFRMALLLVLWASFSAIWGIVAASLLAGLHLFLLLWLWTLLIWQRYHRSAPLWRLGAELFAAALLFALNAPLAGLLFAGVVLAVQSRALFTLDLDRYLADMRLFFTVQAAGARLDWVTMTAIGNALSVKDRYSIPYPRSTRLHPLLKKSLTDSLRAPKALFVLVAFFVLSALVVLQTDLLAPFGPLAFTLLWSMALSTLINQSVEAALKMAAKHAQGLFLPYSEKTLAAYYSLWPTLEAAALQLGLALLTPVQILPALLACALLALLIFTWHRLRLHRPLWQRRINLAASLALMLVSGGLVLGL